MAVQAGIDRLLAGFFLALLGASWYLRTGDVRRYCQAPGRPVFPLTPIFPALVLAGLGGGSAWSPS